MEFMLLGLLWAAGFFFLLVCGQFRGGLFWRLAVSACWPLVLLSLTLRSLDSPAE